MVGQNASRSVSRRQAPQLIVWGKRARTRDEILVATQALLLLRSAGSLSVTDIAAEAGLSHGTFYNYFDTIGALLDDLGALIVSAHANRLAAAARSAGGPVAVFAAKTRQTLRFAAERGDYGRILFDAGLPIDRLAGALRGDLVNDLHAGFGAGVFRADDAAVAAGLLSGCVVGVALDLHRGRLEAAAIDLAAAEMLGMLGVAREAARRASTAAITFAPAPATPLTWRSLAEAQAAP